MKFTIATLGCKVNQHESDVLAAALSAHGWQTAGGDDIADVCVVNTCTVTQRASMQSRQLIRQLQRAHPGARIIVTGCYAQVSPRDIEAIQGVYAVVGQSRKMDLPELIVGAAEESDAAWRHSADVRNPAVSFPEPPLIAPGTRTRPFLKIQDGCNSFCTYCIVPYARGRSRSMRPEQVLTHLARLGASGYREVVLTGIHLGAYGLDLSPARDLSDLLASIEQQGPMARIRLSSIEPHELTGSIVDRVAASRVFCPHFHLPLQSGDDTILKKMHRPYTRDLFRRTVETIKARIPHASVGADVLVGFPGEDQRAFDNTARLIETLPLSYLHVFPFSARPGTPAAGYPDQIGADVIKQRTAQIRALGAGKKTAFMRAVIGCRAAVLVESRRDAATGRLKGLSANYLSVLLEGGDQFMNTIVPVVIQDIHDAAHLKGKIALASDARNPSWGKDPKAGCHDTTPSP